MYVVHRNTLSDSFRIRIAWVQPKQNSDRKRISFFKNRIGSDSENPLLDLLCKVAMLKMIRFPDRDPTGFCNSEPDGTGFWKDATGSDLYIQTALITAVKCLIRVFFWYKPDWIKHLDRSTRLRSDRITQWKFWTGLGLPKSPICSTLQGRVRGKFLLYSTDSVSNLKYKNLTPKP